MKLWWFETEEIAGSSWGRWECGMLRQDACRKDLHPEGEAGKSFLQGSDRKVHIRTATWAELCILSECSNLNRGMARFDVQICKKVCAALCRNTGWKIPKHGNRNPEGAVTLIQWGHHSLLLGVLCGIQIAPVLIMRKLHTSQYCLQGRKRDVLQEIAPS